MPGFNKVMLIGNLTRDPQIKHLPSGTVVAEFGIATSRKYKSASGEDKEDTAFVDCAAFGKQAEVIGQFCQKGKPLFIEGRLKFDSWEDKIGGGKRSKLSVVVENFQFLGSRGREPSDDDNAPARKPSHRGPVDERAARGGGAPGRKAEPPAERPFGDEQVFDEESIPFAWEWPMRGII